ncbi:MAG: hypothetical protein PHF45_00540 [Candidatus Pacebacteria bacterium]|nr:hypothetical protein [Candidatus Paceibacterota bacterium]
MPYYIKEVLLFIFGIIRDFWWLIVLFFLGRFYVNLKKQFKAKEKKEKETIKDWVVLEAKINREILQTPKAMEQVFNSLNVIEKGRLSLEIVGINREMHFIIRAPKEYRHLVTSQFYSQYPEIEIKEIEDYFSSVAPNLPNKDFDLWGTEIIFEKANCYPIKTYSYFEEAKEEKRIDPMASLAETLSTLERSEWCIFQISIRSLSKDEEKELNEEGKKEMDDLSGKKAPKTITWMDWVAAFFRNLLVGVIEPPIWPGEGEKKESPPAGEIALSKKNKISAIEKKISQLSFKTGIRVLYVAPHPVFNESKAIGFMAYLKQFNSKDLNAFKVNEEASTTVKTKLFQARRLFLKKRNFYQAAAQRKPEQKSIILTSEELATIYHFPALKIKAPTLTRVLSKKGEPPVGLPIG